VRTIPLNFVAGFVAGTLIFAVVGPARKDIDQGLQNTAILAAGAIITGLLAYAGAVAAASVVASEGDATRKAGAQASRVERRRVLVSQLAVTNNRLAQEIRDQRAAWEKWNRLKPLPTLSPTTAIEDMVNELYALGFQDTGEAAELLYRCLMRMDDFKFAAGSSPNRPPQQSIWDFAIWVTIQIELKTAMIDKSLRDAGVDRLEPHNRHYDAELNGMFRQHESLILATNGPMGAIKGNHMTQPIQE
jgi:hypothetical protein